MRIGIVGCGFVSTLYLGALQARPELELVGATDLVPERRRRFCARAGVREFESLDHLLERGGAEMILNLTNPSAHYAVNRAALVSRKHVYCEKPLATRLEQARDLVELANQQGLRLSGAPCNLLGEVAQAVWQELRQASIGPPRLVYAELDDGMVHLAPYQRWKNEVGVPWPYQDEFQVGCTLEHAGYYLTWLAAFFGPVISLTRFGVVALPDKRTAVPIVGNAPDLTVACLSFESGVTARLTCSIVAPHNHQLRVVGEGGVLTVADCWDFRSRAFVQKWLRIRRRLLLTPWRRPVRLPPPPLPGLRRFGAARMDFGRGVAELAEAIRFDRPSRLSPEFCLHITELALAIQGGSEAATTYQPSTRFSPPMPMAWAG